MAPDPLELLARLGIEGPGLTVQQLPHNAWLSAGVWRVRGRGFDGALKLTTPDPGRGATPWDRHWTAGGAVPNRWTYWCREALAHRDGLVDAYAGSGLSAPATLELRVEEREAVLLTEWVHGDPGQGWDLPAYGLAAEALGRAQGPFACGRPMPAVDWTSRRFLREYSGEKPVAWELLDDDAAWDHPMVRGAFPPSLRAAARWLHAHRDRLCELSEALPRTLCHLDFWPQNLFRRADGEFVAIDWGFVGDGALGEDIGNLIPDAAFDHFVPAERLPVLERVVFDGYLRGLRSVGWAGDARLVRLGMWSASAKYDWLTPFTLAAVRSGRQLRYGGTEEIDAEYRFRERSRALLFNAGWARRALDLASELGI